MGLDKIFLWHQKFKKLRKSNLYSFRFQIEIIQTILIKIKILAQAVRFDVKNNNKGLSYTNKRCLSLCRHKQFEPWTLLSDIYFFEQCFLSAAWTNICKMPLSVSRNVSYDDLHLSVSAMDSRKTVTDFLLRLTLRLLPPPRCQNADITEWHWKWCFLQFRLCHPNLLKQFLERTVPFRTS